MDMNLYQKVWVRAFTIDSEGKPCKFNLYFWQCIFLFISSKWQFYLPNSLNNCDEKNIYLFLIID